MAKGVDKGGASVETGVRPDDVRARLTQILAGLPESKLREIVDILGDVAAAKGRVYDIEAQQDYEKNAKRGLPFPGAKDSQVLIDRLGGSRVLADALSLIMGPNTSTWKMGNVPDFLLASLFDRHAPDFGFQQIREPQDLIDGAFGYVAILPYNGLVAQGNGEPGLFDGRFSRRVDEYGRPGIVRMNDFRNSSENFVYSSETGGFRTLAEPKVPKDYKLVVKSRTVRGYASLGDEVRGEFSEWSVPDGHELKSEPLVTNVASMPNRLVNVYAFNGYKPLANPGRR
ncbi:MAG: hypothetical protein AAB373_03345 [Patescibacteria group bacterium]